MVHVRLPWHVSRFGVHSRLLASFAHLARSAEFSHAALRPSLLPTMSPTVPHHELYGASNTAVVVRFNYQIAGVRVIRDLPAGMELLDHYAWFVPSRSISVDDLNWFWMSYTPRRLFVVQ